MVKIIIILAIAISITLSTISRADINDAENKNAYCAAAFFSSISEDNNKLEELKAKAGLYFMSKLIEEEENLKQVDELYRKYKAQFVSDKWPITPAIFECYKLLPKQ